MTKTSELSGKDVQGVATRVANGLPDVTQTQAFGPGYEVFKVRGKVFAMTTEVLGEKILTVKCDPDRAQMLCDTHESINPGYHMNKRHWISLGGGPKIDRELVEDLVRSAYELVVESLPKADRPKRAE
ncbi:MmcQ/YjbR family DNA-binding protein [Methylobacterium nodulans]|uniref:MmcQ-like protein n=1 Tax=Methylobacterium nodulans (strain LMG 21967 / CNCM I-2342 / ORS 2060) TaxID=460265 RepID=B8ISJ8_METNO|nr:MmcQ/YjbR family DNA-binding protein [Methylobacterium nodulans]ACL58838.1 protein of unknown function DUF419 [Methylobacterium nodulans ORS 2060]